jgi:hypothetical protein
MARAVNAVCAAGSLGWRKFGVAGPGLRWLRILAVSDGEDGRGGPGGR